MEEYCSAHPDWGGGCLIQREFPVCEGGGESKVLRSRTIEDRNQFRATPVKAWESTEQRNCWSFVGISFGTNRTEGEGGISIQ